MEILKTFQTYFKNILEKSSNRSVLVFSPIQVIIKFFNLYKYESKNGSICIYLITSKFDYFENRGGTYISISYFVNFLFFFLLY